MTDVPPHFDLQYSAEEIANRSAELGSEIGRWASARWDESHTDVIAVPILRGGIFFFADLVRQIPQSVEISPAQSWGYVPGKNDEMKDAVEVNVSTIPAKGRSVLLVDDICDSGRTLQALKKALEERGALEVKSVVLIKRIVEGQCFDPDWNGFEYPGNEWFVGYGMEDNERFRNLKSIYVIRQS
jgi:hypoxanthine phosphoribosyltransferase